MSDDIVTRLRKQMQGCDNRNCEGCEVENEAIDEIERLRTLLDNVLEREYKNDLRQLEIVRKVEADRDTWREDND